MRTLFSRGQPGGPCTSLLPHGSTGRVVPLETIGIDVADYFTPPFRIRAAGAVKSIRALD